MNRYRITLDGKTYEMDVEMLTEQSDRPDAVKTPAKPMVQIAAAKSAAAPAAHGNGIVVSPMPGTVISILKKEQDTVSAGETVLILEAMKMENEIAAPISGVIRKIHCEVSDAVTGGAVLFEIE